MSNAESLTKFLTILLIVMVVVLVILVVVFIFLGIKNRAKKAKIPEKKELKDKLKNKKNNNNAKAYKEYTKESIFKFMDFEKIEDNMIIQDNGRFLMVIECQGVNYDLMSEAEKISVEQGFTEFLNTLRFPIQLYIQTRTVNLQSSIDGYKERLKPIESKYNYMEMQYINMQKEGTYTTKQMQEAYYSLVKQKNLYEYTKDIIADTERMSLNHNVLNKKYYIVVPYDKPDVGNTNYSDEEIQNMAFSELYTKSQSIIRAIMSCEITSRILNSEEIAELLYNAYNREDADVMSIGQAYRAGYEDLYSTAPDVLDKKMDLLDRKIKEDAERLANEKVAEAKSDKEKRYLEKEDDIDDLITELAKNMIQENSRYIGEDIAESAIEKIQNEDKNSKGGNEDENENTTRRRGRPRKS